MKNDPTWITCPFLLAIFALWAFVGAKTFSYCLWSVFGKDVPWYADLVAGIFLAEFTIPGAIVCWICRLCGMEPPFIP